jgi:hypothetical protein
MGHIKAAILLTENSFNETLVQDCVYDILIQAERVLLVDKDGEGGTIDAQVGPCLQQQT